MIGIIESVKVSEKDEITHNLVITFREAYVDDKLIWINEKKKSLGYNLKNGKKNKRINNANISKKNTINDSQNTDCFEQLSRLQLNNQPLIVVFKNI